MPQARPATGLFRFVATTTGHQAALLLAQLDLERIAWLEAEHVGVGPAHHEITVGLPLVVKLRGGYSIPHCHRKLLKRSAP